MPKKRQPFSVLQRLGSFRHALEGIRTLLHEEHNARVHLAATASALILGLTSGLTRWEWLALIIAISLVWVSEALNTGIEAACDLVTLERHPMIKKAKDVAAAAVLISALTAIIVGLVVFLPHWFNELS